MEAIMIKGTVILLGGWLIIGAFILTDTNPLDFVETLIDAIERLLYSIFIRPFKAFGSFLNKRRNDKKLLLEKQIELEKIKRQNWENGIS